MASMPSQPTVPPVLTQQQLDLLACPVCRSPLILQPPKLPDPPVISTIHPTQAIIPIDNPTAAVISTDQREWRDPRIPPTPVTTTPQSRATILCTGCKRIFPISDGLPVLIPNRS